jgi:hypothetical protein
MTKFSTGRSAGKAQHFHKQIILPLTLTDFSAQKIFFHFVFQSLGRWGR